MSEGVVLCYGNEDPGYLVTFGRRDTLSFSEQTFSILPSDFEIVPRDPETYKDWQVGDKIAGRYSDKGGEVIFRCGELVIYKYKDDGRASIPFTCEELFDNKDCRLVLTDIEQQIIEGQKEYEPQDGDIVAWKDKDDDGNPAISIYKEKGRGYATIYAYGSTEYSTYVTFAMNIIRPATDEETRRLFDLYCIRETIEAFTKAGFNECVVNPETVGQYTGVKDRDGDIDRIQASGVSRSQQYRMAGNSIVVSVLFHIFRKMFVDTGSDNNELELF